MVRVDDPHGVARRLQNELRRHRESEDVTNLTAKRVEEFATAHERGKVADDEELATSSLVKYCRALRAAAEAFDGHLASVSGDGLESFLEDIEKEYASSTHGIYVSGLTKFDRYHDIGWDVEWEWINADPPKVDPEKLFTDEEVRDLLEEGDLRRQATVGLFADLGPRIGALCSFRIRDVELEDDVPQIRFNTDANVKSAEGKVLLTWSAGYLQTYLANAHPRPDDPNAPLIHKKQRYDPDDPEDDGALSPATLRSGLKRLGENVGIPRDRMKPHNFRHTAVSNWIRQGWEVSDIVHRASWASPQMLKIYDNVTDEQRNESLAARLGLVDEDDVASEPGDATMDCPRCSTTVRRDVNYCPRCSFDLGADATADVPDPAEPGVPDDEGRTEAWPDGSGGLEDIPNETLVRELIERGDLDPSVLLEE